MRRFFSCVAILMVALFFATSPGEADGRVVAKVGVTGNAQVVADHILSVVETKIGQPLDPEQVKKDIESIYNLGFFSMVDAKVDDEPDGASVTFLVTENPVIKSIRFEGNTVFPAEKLQEVIFTTPGSIFNRVFFQHDLERIKERYQKEGYVLMRVADVQVEGGEILVKIIEPKVGDVIVQGNKRTKTYVIERQLKLKKGELFNATKLRNSLNRLQGLGYFEDVSVGFEPTDAPDMVNVVLTVEEKKTGRVQVSIGHGSSSGWSGGLAYDDPNWQGRGQDFNAGFETGEKEQYWITWSDSYMDNKTYAWKFGGYKRTWTDLLRYNEDNEQVKYDQQKTGFYVGAGKRFGRSEEWSWFLTLDWHEVEVTPTSGDFDPYYAKNNLLNGKVFTVEASLQRKNVDENVSYPKGDVETLTVQNAMEVLGGDYSYTKYWLEAKGYFPITGVDKYIDLDLEGLTDDNPIIFAARIKAGFSGGEVPWAEQYFVGGPTSIRGYKDDRFEGDEMFLANVELRVPVDKNFSVVAFYDTGNAWDTDAGQSFSFSDLKSSPGFGVRVKTPLGNVRLDIAEGDDETETTFGFGELF